GKRQLELAMAVERRRARGVNPELDLLLLQLVTGARGVDAKIHLLVVVAVIDAFDHAGGAMQGAKSGANKVVTGLCPRRVLLRLRADRRRGHTTFRGRCALDDRLEQTGRRPSAHELVDVAEVQPKLVVPDRVHARVVLAAEPPEPVAAFRDQDL